MLRSTVTTLLAFTAMLVGFSFLAGISKMDVSIKHDMQRHVTADPFRIGDVVEVSPDGLRQLGLLCSVDLGMEKQRSNEIHAY